MAQETFNQEPQVTEAEPQVEQGVVSEETVEGQQESFAQAPAQDVPDVNALMRRIDEAERRAEFYQNLASFNQNQQQQYREPEVQQPQIDPYAPLSGAEADSLVQARLNPLQQEMMRTKQQLRSQMIISQEVGIKNQFPDYSDVINTYARDIFSRPENRGMYEAIMERAENPALVSYQIGISHPDYQKKKLSKATNGNAQMAQQNLQKPSTMATVGGKSAVGGTIDFAKMSKDEFEREVQRVKMTP